MDVSEVLQDYLSKLPKLNRIDAKIVLADLYDKTFSICDHHTTALSRPLSSVAFHDAEKINEDSVLEETMRVYISRHIYENFKLSYLQFMELPRDIAQMVIKISDEYAQKKSQTMTELEKELSGLKG